MGKPDPTIRRLRDENRILKHRLEVAETSTGTPEIDQLILVYRRAVWLADPTSASRLNSTRSTFGEYLSASCMTTAEGAATYPASRRLEAFRRELRHLATQWKDKIEGNTKRPGDERPRCWVRTKKHTRGLRLPYGSVICSVCQSALPTEENDD